MSNAIVIPMPPAPTYGAVEIKEFIRKNTYRAFFITLGLFLLLILLYFVYGLASAPKTGTTYRAPFSKVIIDVAQTTEEQPEDAPPPPNQQVVDYATAARAGTPIPVPDAQIKEDLKEFANVDELNKSLSKNEGQIVDLNNLPNNFAFDEGNKVQKEDQMPSEDEFVAVEKEPNVDLAELQKKVVYPETARRAGVEGKVTIRVLVAKDGKVKQTKIAASESSMLDQAAIDAVKRSVFTPAIQNGQPIACWVTIPIVFKLR